MPRCGRPARRAVSRPVCADEKNPALSVDRKLFGTSTIGSHPVRSAPAVAPHDPPRSADACRSAIGRPILHFSEPVLRRSGQTENAESSRVGSSWGVACMERMFLLRVTKIARSTARLPAIAGGCLVDHPIRTITWNPRVGEQAYSIFLILAS